MRGKVRRVTASLCSKTAGREARPATPEAGVLPNFWEWSACGWGRAAARPRTTSRSSLPIIGVPAVRAAEDLSRRNGCGFGFRQLFRPVHALLWTAAGTGAVEFGIARRLVRLGL